MTTAQRITVEKLQADGFSIICHHADMVLMASGADHRLVRVDGSQKRGKPVGAAA